MPTLNNSSASLPGGSAGNSTASLPGGLSAKLTAGAASSTLESSEQTPVARYVVGIDLGTTNSAVGYADLTDPELAIHSFLTPQLVGPGLLERRETLPSFFYQPAADEFPSGAIALPWDDQPQGMVGTLARDQGVKSPGRLVSSAKSWLSHSGVDRTANLLPWHAARDVERISPVDASARYLQHIRLAWNALHPGFPLEQQEIVLTLPASFDEIARELTVRAAHKAGLPRVILIEEPQAAFYAWINKHRHDWQTRISAGQTILVCDIGGGTSDFTLIRARPSEGGTVQFHRVAVGEHLILGGDNLDLALARHLEAEVTGGKKLDPRPWESLVRQSRVVKETLLAENAPESLTVSLAGSGSRLIGGALQAVAVRAAIQQLLIEGFLPATALTAALQVRHSGFQEFGLPYAADPAISRHLAAFLSAHRAVLADQLAADGLQVTHDPARPDAVLFNGGFFASPVLQQRLLEILGGWFAVQGQTYQPTLLDHARLDLAVAWGAAYYGLVRRGHGVRISAGLARTYYVAVDAPPDRASPDRASPDSASPDRVSSDRVSSDRVSSDSASRAADLQATAFREQVAVCLVPAGTEAGQEFELQQPRFELRVSEPVELPILVSSVRLTDKPGAQIPIDRDQFTALPPIRTVLRSRKAEDKTIPVQLRAGLSEIGTLDLACQEVDGPRSWRLQFDVRSTTQTDMTAHESAAEAEGVLDEQVWHAVRNQLTALFAPATAQSPSSFGPAKPGQLMKSLISEVGLPREEWPTSLLRRMWEHLLELEAGRRLSPEHETRWLNLTGFALRPGYGYALDDWRVSETWKGLRNRLIHAKPQSIAEWRIFWRRIAGGLEAGQQQTLADPLLAELRQLKPGGKSVDPATLTELFRLLASLERLSVSRRVEFGELAIPWLKSEKTASLHRVVAWSLGRTGARVPSYGPLNAIVPAEDATGWLNLLLASDLPAQAVAFPIVQLARYTHDRFRDLPERARHRAIDWLERHAAANHLIRLVKEGGTLEREEQNEAFGESLPRGLRLGS